MSELPDRALYKCPQHGVFLVNTDGVLWRERCCPVLLVGDPARGNLSYPCGILSPLAHVDDPDVMNGPITGLEPDKLSDLRESLKAALAARAAEKLAASQDLDKPTFMFGGNFTRRNGRKVEVNSPPPKDVEQELFENEERKRMRAAMNDVWED